MQVAPVMSKRIFLFSLVFAAALASARDKQENWLEVSSQHFTVYCDGNEKQGRHIADQFERMRAVFHTAFPNVQIDPSAPIVVIAVRDAKDFRALEPEAYLAKGQLELTGLFLRAPDKNYVLLRTDPGGLHPYATVYHEYTHLVFSKAAEWLPLWLNEGLAEFYQNTDIGEKDTVVGQSSADDILWLRQNRLLPLTTLLTVDYKSPYYHEEQKGSVFYSESWALTHYLQVTDAQKNTNRVKDYVSLVANHVDPVTAATTAFGDLKQLQTALEKYVQQPAIYGFTLTRVVPVDDTTFRVQPIPPAQADAVRADFLAYNQREKDARALLAQVLQDAPNNTLAHETMGYLEYRAGHLEQAQDWYQQAAKLDSQSYLANYYFASIALNRGQTGADLDGQIENSLQKAIKLNPSFAPPFDQLAAFYGMRHKNLDQAYLLSQQAVQLDPGNLRFRLNAASILFTMERGKDAIPVLQTALKLAKTPEEVLAVQNEMEMIQQSQAARAQMEEENRKFKEEMNAANAQTSAPATDESVNAPPELKERLKGPHRFVTGIIKNVHCSPPANLDLDVDTGGKTIGLYTRNYYKLVFTALNFMPKSDLQPCSDLEGMFATVEYVETTGREKAGGLVSIELRR